MIRLLLVALMFAVTPCVAQDIPPSWAVRIFADESGDSEPEGTGSGVLITGELIVTNDHVIKRAKNRGGVSVLFGDWSVEDATVVYRNPKWDLALVKLNNRSTMTPIKLGTDPKFNDKVVLYGFGSGAFLRQEGVVKGHIKVPGIGSNTPEEHDDHLLFTALPRQGDSGGAVTDVNGKLVGIVNMRTRSDGLFIVQSQVRKMVRNYVQNPNSYKTNDTYPLLIPTQVK